MLVIALLSVLSLTTSAQNDTCYTKDQNRKILSALIDGSNCKQDYIELKGLYDVSEKIRSLQSSTLTDLKLYNDSLVVENNSLTIQNEVLDKKRKNRNGWIITLAVLLTLTNI